MLRGAACAAALALLAGCSAQPGAATPTAARDAVAPTATAVPGAAGGATPGTQPPLVLWTVPAFDPTQPSLSRLSAVLDGFSATRAGPPVRVSVKPAGGPTGIEAFLSSTQRVAPGALPDVAVLPLDLVEGAAAQGLLEAIPATVPQARIEDAFPFARRRARTLAGAQAVPLAVDVLHGVRAGETPAATWSEIPEEERYGLPLAPGEPGGPMALLTLYHAAGGRLDTLPAADVGAVRSALGVLEDGTMVTTLPSVNGLPDAEAVWQALRQGTVDAAAVRAGRFAAQQPSWPGLVWGPLPGPSSSAPPLAWGWVLVVTTRDPERARRAGELIAWLTAPERRAWVLDAEALPAWRVGWQDTVATALTPTPAEAYLAFVERQLDRAESIDGATQWGQDWVRAAEAIAAGAPLEEAVANVAP